MGQKATRQTRWKVNLISPACNLSDGVVWGSFPYGTLLTAQKWTRSCHVLGTELGMKLTRHVEMSRVRRIPFLGALSSRLCLESKVSSQTRMISDTNFFGFMHDRCILGLKLNGEARAGLIRV